MYAIYSDDDSILSQLHALFREATAEGREIEFFVLTKPEWEMFKSECYDSLYVRETTSDDVLVFGIQVLVE